jgi:hypothetical protein
VKTHQVIVFTHDARLPESVRRLQIPARFIEVTRRENSVVELKEARDPVSAHLEDAIAVALTKEIPDNVRGNVVPGFCRFAVEAACIEVVRRRRIGRGDPHADVEDALEGATVNQLAAMALFDDPRRGGEVMGRLNQLGAWAATTFRRCKEGAHVAYGGDMRDLVNDTKGLTDKLLQLT